MKILSLLLLSLTLSFSAQLETTVAKTNNSTNLKIKKTRWLEPDKVFIYEVEYAKKNYTLKYSYGKQPGLEILDARQSSQMIVHVSQEETALILKGKTIKKSPASKKMDISKDIAPELIELIQMDLINMPGFGMDDQINDAGYQTNYLGNLVGYIRGVVDRFTSDCYSTASCNCPDIGTASARCVCGQTATCGTIELQQCRQGPSGPEACRTETRCMATCR